jgi:hypothetical protein
VPRTPTIKLEDLARALKEFDGNYSKTAEHFGVNARHIRERVYREPQLRAVWVKNGVEDPIPDDTELMVRQPIEPIAPPDGKLMEALDKNSRSVFNKDLESLLSNPNNVEKLKIFEEFDDSVGLLMAEALRITQKVNIRQNMTLFEITESMKDDLGDPTMDTEERILKTRVFLQACEQQGKFFDRMLKGLDSMLKLTEKSEKKKKKKPGFMPLKELKKLEEDKSEGTD